MPDSGTGNACGNSKITSGFGIPQPSTKFGDAGMSLGSPCGAPAFTQATMVLISFSVSARSFEKCPKLGSVNHGGIIFWLTTRFMLGAQGRACSYVSSGNGAASPGRWQVWQFFWRIGAMSLVKVTLALLAVWLNE